MSSLPAFLFCFTMAASAVVAQSPNTFEVASIRLGDPLQSGTSFELKPAGGIKIQGASLKSLLLFAYDLREFQLSGAKGWMASERYTILAKGVMIDGPADYRHMNDQQQKAMAALIRKRLQMLLADRFQLAVHSQTKELPIYALVAAKNGPKMEPNLSPDGSVQSMSTGLTMLKAKRASTEEIASALASIVGRPVIDQTGLKGFYDLKVEWTPDAAASAPGVLEEKPAANSGPTLFTALQEQIGLKLESRKGPVETLVVDRAERPSDN
jgi:bla regulator protein blaR1